ncbi:pyridoxamine 5'-phosphate oxidase [Kwoniella shandongensis]|uniref:pyridoxal 5'-phosphate synthase n=1 Tax=Kwoniella shandongensis TaxID=1734106 RepID=A0A5M6BZH2_9TREE|nr:pyridoxamine 5'-phosphate oxidase [Kwoniella shandongensis]KAA5526379.1 pyridoxamine 5'-phosphate oxidase [Kwoniella shandongensis]
MSNSTLHLYGTPAPQPDTSDTSQPTDDGAPKKIHLTSHNQYKTPRLLPSHLSPSPLLQFNAWLSSALSPPDDGTPIVKEPEAMTVSTSLPNGIPSSRVVLLKTVDDTGFVFFTNYNSRKSRELTANPYAALAFYWREISRSVRVVGRVEKVKREESVEYFNTRPRGSKIGAWASEQSTTVGEETLEKRVEETEKRWEGKEVECPEHWGGWRVVPFEVEFWSGQPSRLHDRFRYTRPEGSEGEWKVERLSP